MWLMGGKGEQLYESLEHINLSIITMWSVAIAGPSSERWAPKRELSALIEKTAGERTPFSFPKTMKTLKGFKGSTDKLFQKIGCKTKIVHKIQSNTACKFHREGKPRMHCWQVKMLISSSAYLCFIIRAPQYRTYSELSPRKSSLAGKR